MPLARRKAVLDCSAHTLEQQVLPVHKRGAPGCSAHRLEQRVVAALAHMEEGLDCSAHTIMNVSKHEARSCVAVPV